MEDEGDGKARPAKKGTPLQTQGQGENGQGANQHERGQALHRQARGTQARALQHAWHFGLRSILPFRFGLRLRPALRGKKNRPLTMQPHGWLSPG